jgi:outer membrane protein assembly factor BamE
MSRRIPIIPSCSIVLLGWFLGACSNVPLLFLTPYKMDVQQGNFVTQDMIAKLQLGMTRSQVRFALGTPLVVDPFRNDRWDYVYRYMKAGAVTEQRLFKVHFSEDKLARVEGEGVPAALNPAPAGKPAVPAAPAAPAAPPEQPIQTPVTGGWNLSFNDRRPV